MHTTLTQLVHIPRSAAIAGLIVVSGFIAVTMQTPTHALSLNLGDTVNTVAASVPVVNQLTPLLMTSSTTPTATTTTTPTVAPTMTPTTQTTLIPAVTAPVTSLLTPTTPTQSTPTTSTATTPAKSTSAATATTQPAAASTVSSQALTTQASIAARSAITPVGLTSAANQSQIAAAALHGGAPDKIVYSSHTLDPKVATTLFAIGIAGLVAGGVIMYAVRPRMIVA